MYPNCITESAGIGTSLGKVLAQISVKKSLQNRGIKAHVSLPIPSNSQWPFTALQIPTSRGELASFL